MYRVVTNIDGRHALSPTARDTPAGWDAVGFAGTANECADYVDIAEAEPRPITPRAVRAVADHPVSTDPALAIRSAPPGPWDLERCVHHLVADTVRRQPGAIAIEEPGAELTYAELDQRSALVARALRARGVGPDIRVAVCLPSSIDAFVAMLGLLRAGGVYLPLDPAYPGQRLKLMHDNASPACVIGPEDERERPARSADWGADWVCVSALLREGAESSLSEDGDVTADNLLYVVYTSGSTGTPKGVGMEHRAIVNLVEWQAAIDGPCRRIQFAPISFDSSVHEIFATWCAGGTLVVLKPGGRRDLVHVAHALRERRVEQFVVTATALNEVARVCVTERIELPHLRKIIASGEPLVMTPELLGLLEFNPGVVLENQYGTSEIHTVTNHFLTGSPGEWPHLPPVGSPLPGTEVGILAEDGSVAVVGEVGEVFAGGVCLSRGYLGQWGRTAQRFVPHPIAAGRVVYRTGDLGRMTEDGLVEVLGRMDDQLKIRGSRIELGEVEATLRRHPRVVDAAAFAVRRDGRPERLAAAIVTDGPAVDQEELRALLAEWLPPFMIPGSVGRVESLPRTPSGKVDRLALERDLHVRAESDRRGGPPRGPDELRVAAAMSMVLGLENLGRHDEFLSQGGTSLSAVQLVSRLRSEFGTDVSVRAVFEGGTVASLAEAVRGAPPLGLNATPRRAESASAPLAPVQRSLWLLHTLEPEGTAYNLGECFRLRGMLDVDALATAVDRLVERHQILRTRFQLVDGAPVQVVDEPRTGLLRRSEAPANADRAVLAQAFAEDEMWRPFDLARDAVFRAHLRTLGSDDYVLALTMHHLVTDSWSADVMRRDLSTLYKHALDGAEAVLPELPIQYADHSVRQVGEEEQTTARELPYWVERLTGAPQVLELPPCGRPDDRAGRTWAGGAVEIVLDASLERELMRVSEAADATVFMTSLAVFGMALSRMTGSPDLLVGVPCAARTRPEIEPLMGYFVNLLPVRVNCGEASTFDELLRQVRDTTIGAFAHQDVPFERIVEAFAPPRRYGRNPLVQATFQVLDEQSPLELGDVVAHPVNVDERTSRFDLSMDIIRGPRGLRARVTHRHAVLDEHYARQLLEAFRELLTEVCARAEHTTSGGLMLNTASEHG